MRTRRASAKLSDQIRVLEHPPAEMFRSIRGAALRSCTACWTISESICGGTAPVNRQTRCITGCMVVAGSRPLSIALLVLGGVHAIAALRYEMGEYRGAPKKLCAAHRPELFQAALSHSAMGRILSFGLVAADCVVGVGGPGGQTGGIQPRSLCPFAHSVHLEIVRGVHAVKSAFGQKVTDHGVPGLP